MYSRLPLLAAVALWFATAGSGFAQVGGWLAYRNDSKFTIAVQASYTVNNQERRGPAHLMNPREAAADQVFGAGQKTITVYDPKTGKQLGRLVVPFIGKDLFFLIQVEGGANNAPARATIVPVLDPRTVPGGFPGLTQGFTPGIVPPTLTSPSSPTLPAIVGLNPVMSPAGPVLIPSAPKLPGIPR